MCHHCSTGRDVYFLVWGTGVPANTLGSLEVVGIYVSGFTLNVGTEQSTIFIFFNYNFLVISNCDLVSSLQLPNGLGRSKRRVYYTRLKVSEETFLFYLSRQVS